MNINRTQEEIDFETESFQQEVIELRKDMHDNCDMNVCHECVPKFGMTDIQNIAIELDHAIRHKITLIRFRGNNA